MIPSYSIRGHIRYWYYVSEPHLRGQTKIPAGSEPRVPANDIEAIVIKTLKQHLTQTSIAVSDTDDRELITAHIERIVISKREIAIHLKPSDRSGIHDDSDRPDSKYLNDDAAAPVILSASWSKPRGKKFRELLLPPSTRRETTRPIKAERKAALLRAISRAWGSRGPLNDSRASIETDAFRLSRHRLLDFVQIEPGRSALPVWNRNSGGRDQDRKCAQTYRRDGSRKDRSQESPPMAGFSCIVCENL